MLFNRLTFNTLLDAAMPIDLHLLPTSVGGSGLVCTDTWSRLPAFLVKEFSVLNFKAKRLSGVSFVMISRYLGREEIWYVEAFYAPNSFL